MAEFNFKSSGLKITDRIVDNEEVQPKVRPIGIKTPLQFGNNSSMQLFEMNSNPAEQVKDNLRNLVLTEKGERLGMPEYGCGIRSHLFDLAAVPDYETFLANLINEQIETYMPFLLVKDIRILDYAKATDESELKSRNGMAALVVRISFDIPRIRISNQGLEVVILAGG